MPRQNDRFTVNALADLLGHDRRSLKRWLLGVPAAGTQDGNPVYRLEDVRAAVNRHVEKREKAKNARDRLDTLKAEKLAVQIGIMRQEYRPASELEQIGYALGTAIAKVVRQIHLCAPSVVGLSVADAESRLKELEDDILDQLHLIDDEIAKSKKAQQTQVESHFEGFSPRDP